MIARKLVDRLVQFGIVEDLGDCDATGAVIWHPTEEGAHLQAGARLLMRSGIIGTHRLRDEQIGEFILGGLLEFAPDYRWRPTELATVLLELPCALAPPDHVRLH